VSATTHRLYAMKDADVKIAVIHVDRGYLVFANGVEVGIRYFDADWQPVADPDEAVWYEFGDDEFGWGTARFRQGMAQEWNH
jgi:hypothetical protein